MHHQTFQCRPPHHHSNHPHLPIYHPHHLFIQHWQFHHKSCQDKNWKSLTISPRVANILNKQQKELIKIWLVVKVNTILISTLTRNIFVILAAKLHEPAFLFQYLWIKRYDTQNFELNNLPWCAVVMYYHELQKNLGQNIWQQSMTFHQITLYLCSLYY